MRRFSTRDLTALAGAVVLAGLAPGCFSKEDGAARLNQLYPQPDAGVFAACPLPDEPDAGTSMAPASGCVGLLQGQWAARFVQFSNISPISIVWNLRITDLFLVSVGPDMSSLQLTFCDEINDLTDPSTGDVVTLGATTTPQALITGVGANPVTLPIAGDSLQSPVPWIWGVMGITNPATDPLPTAACAMGAPSSASCTQQCSTQTTGLCVWDEDNDGFPGVTVDVSEPTGQRYMTRRAIWNFGPTDFSGVDFGGPLTFSIEQNAIGATNSQLLTPTPITPNPGCTSVYQAACVAPSLTCADVVANYQTLFLGAPL